MNLKNLPRVAVIYPYLTYYHTAFMSELLGSKNANIDLYAGTNTGPISIKVISHQIEQSKFMVPFTTVVNYWILKKILWQSGVLKVAWDDSYDVVIYAGNVYYLSTWVSLIIGRIRGKKNLLKTHGMLREENGVKGIIRRIFYKIADGLLLYEQRAKKLLAEKFFNIDKLYVTYNSLDYASQKKIRSALTMQDDIRLKKTTFQFADLPLLIFIGRLTKTKQLDLLIKAVRLLHDKGHKVNAVIIGNGVEFRELIKATKDSDLEIYIKFLGEKFEESDVGPWLHAADICISPGEVGLTAMHALAYGTPVITHNDFDYQMPEVEAIQENVSGAFFEHGSVESLACSIRTWLYCSGNREDIRSHCIKIIEEKYNPTVQVEVFLQAINDVLRKR